MNRQFDPYEAGWREAVDAMPPWLRRVVEMAVDQGAGFTSAREDLPPGRGRPATRQAGPPFDPFSAAFGRAFMGGALPPWGRGRARAGRGDIRAAILALLAEAPMHGYQLMQEMSDRSGGVWRPSPGSVYPTLSQLEDEGLVEGQPDGGKRVYTLTHEGRAAAEAADDSPWDTVGETVDDDVRSLREEIASTAGAVMAVATSANADHIEAARSILAETRRSLYRLLADDAGPGST